MNNLKKLPTLNELYSNPVSIDKHNRLNILLASDPKPEWIRPHPLDKSVRYIPVGIIEWILTSIFVRWHLEVKHTQVIANSVVVTVRLHVQDPITGDWDFQDGIGAAPIQTAKGASSTDFTQVLSGAVMKAAPAAESYALKDAAEKFGRILGKDLNRKEIMPYTNLDGKIDLDELDCTPDNVTELYDLLYRSSLTNEEVDDFRNKLAGRVTISAYLLYKRELLDAILHPIDRVRNGENLSQKLIGQAVNDKL